MFEIERRSNKVFPIAIMKTLLFLLVFLDCRLVRYREVIWGSSAGTSIRGCKRIGFGICGIDEYRSLLVGLTFECAIRRGYRIS